MQSKILLLYNFFLLLDTYGVVNPSGEGPVPFSQRSYLINVILFFKDLVP